MDYLWHNCKVNNYNFCSGFHPKINQGHRCVPFSRRSTASGKRDRLSCQLRQALPPKHRNIHPVFSLPQKTLNDSILVNLKERLPAIKI